MRDKNKKSTARAKSLRSEMPEAEHRLWYFIRKKQLDGFQFRKQHPVGPYITDFACVKKNLIIEVDGATHSTDEEREYDTRRTRYLESKGWKVIRYPNEDIYKHIDDVLDDITAHLKGLK